MAPRRRRARAHAELDRDPRDDAVRPRRLRGPQDPPRVRAVREDAQRWTAPRSTRSCSVCSIACSAPTSSARRPASRSAPARPRKPLHPDDAIYPVPRPHAELVVNVMWPLEDFTEANGATRVVPGSHRWVDEATHARRRDRLPSRCAPVPRSSTSAASGTAAVRTDGASAAGRRAALRGRLAATGREPRARGAARRRARAARTACRSSSATTSSRRSSATSTAATRSACSTPERRGSRRSAAQNREWLSLDRCERCAV